MNPLEKVLNIYPKNKEYKISKNGYFLYVKYIVEDGTVLVDKWGKDPENEDWKCIATKIHE